MTEPAVPAPIDTRPLLEWYRAHQRDLPWRRRQHDPYAVWVSEVMLQQTQVATVIPFYERWMARFPTVEALATAPLEEVLRHWAGLGYYARARNMHRAAGVIVERHGGRFPDDPAALAALPGIGRYTAGAVLSIAFEQPAPLVDANVARVLSRIYTLDGDPKSAANQALLYGIARSLLMPPSGSPPPPSELNQGLMELGALVCTPADPACERCPLLYECRAGNSPDPTAWPQTAPGRATVRVVHACALLREGERLLLVRRPPHGLWGGLWELPRRACASGETPAACAGRAAREVVGIEAHIGSQLTAHKHTVTHHAITLYAFRADAWTGEPRPLDCAAVRWVTPDELARLPMSSPQAVLIGAILEPVDQFSMPLE